MRGARAVCQYFQSRPQSPPTDDDLDTVHVNGGGEGPGGPGGAEDALADEQVPHKEPQVLYLDV